MTQQSVMDAGVGGIECRFIGWALGSQRQKPMSYRLRQKGLDQLIPPGKLSRR